MPPSPRLLPPLAVLGLALLAALAIAAPAPTAAGATGFGKVQFEEVLSILEAKYIEPELKAPHIWAAAANGAVKALRKRIELLPSSFVAVQKFSEGRFSGKTTPLTCKGRTIPGVVIHRIPRRKKGDKPYGAGNPQSTGEPLVDALLAWPPPFTRADFACVVDWVQGQLVARSDPVPRGWRGKKLPDEVAKRRRQQLWRTAATYLLRALDPHSKLTTERKWAAVNEAFTRVVSLGISLQWKAGRALISDVDKDSEAAIRGVRPNDVIVAVDGKSTAGMKQAQVEKLLGRPPGSRVTLSLERVGSLRPIIVQLAYMALKAADVQVTRIKALPGAVRIKISKFAPGGDERVREGLQKARESGPVDAILLDMRGNGGGIVPVAVGLIETFVGGGLVARVKTRDAVAGVPITRRRRRIERAPMVVLVDARCASACEFTSGALQDSLRALVVGERTYGKATLQEFTSMKTTTAKVMVTIAMFFSPTGHPIQATGISPDFPVPLKAGKKMRTIAREEDVPFNLSAATLAKFRDVSYWKPAVAACAGKPDAKTAAAADFRLARATTYLGCLRKVIADWHQAASIIVAPGGRK